MEEEGKNASAKWTDPIHVLPGCRLPLLPAANEMGGRAVRTNHHLHSCTNGGNEMLTVILSSARERERETAPNRFHTLIIIIIYRYLYVGTSLNIKNHHNHITGFTMANGSHSVRQFLANLWQWLPVAWICITNVHHYCLIPCRCLAHPTPKPYSSFVVSVRYLPFVSCELRDLRQQTGRKKIVATSFDGSICNEQIAFL